MKKRLFCAFLACVITFTGFDFTVAAAETGHGDVIAADMPETVESGIAERQEETTEELEGSDETNAGELTGSEEGEPSETEEQEDPKAQEGESAAGEKSEDGSEGTEEEKEGEEKSEDEENSEGEENFADEESSEDTEDLAGEENQEDAGVEEDAASEDADDLTERTVQESADEVEVYAAWSSDSVNAAVKDYIYSFKSTYPEGSVWSSSYDGGKQCFGFAMLIADKVFGCHPKNTSIRKASDGTVSNGWTCYYVNAGNCNSLAVEPGDIIDSPTKATSSHTAMVCSVSGSSITCVQCNLSGNCKVYWTQNFNYNSKNASLSQIYSRFGGYGTIRLWKPSEAMKNAIAGSMVVDTEAPRVGNITLANSGGYLVFDCTATDNVGIVRAWATLYNSNVGSRNFTTTISGNKINGKMSSFDITDGQYSVNVYVQDSAGNIGSNSVATDFKFSVTMEPDEIVIEVGEKSQVSVSIDTGMYHFGGSTLGYNKREEGIITVDYGGGINSYAKIEGMKPGSLQFFYNVTLFLASSNRKVELYSNVYVLPKAPTLTSITSTEDKCDRIEYTPSEYAETYELYRLREGTDSDYQLIATFKNDGTNTYTVEHPMDGSTYFYKMTAKAAQTTLWDEKELYYPTSRFSNILTSTTSSFTPTGLTAVSNRDNEIDLAWDAVEGASGYEIYRYTEDAAKELLAVRNASQTSYTDTDVDGGVTYCYDVYAVDIVGEKGMEATVSCVAKGFREEKIFYTVRFHTGFDAIWIAEEEVEKGQCSQSIASSCEQMQMEGYEFVGWYAKPDGAGECYTSETPIMSDTVLYAFWKKQEEDRSGKFWVVPVGDQKYTGKAIKPTVKVYDGNTLLVQGTDYTVSYKNNVKVCDAGSVETAKAPSVIVKGRKNYSDHATIPFSIIAVDLNESGVTAEDMIAAYTGRELKPVPVLYYNGRKLKYKTDYTVISPQSLRDVGQYSIEVVGRGGYAGRRKIPYTITDKLLLSKANVSKIPNQIYSGRLHRPALTVKYGGVLLREDVSQDGTGDYAVRYINNRNIGTATVVLTAVEGSPYTGSKSVTFKITGTPVSKVSVAPIGSRTYSGSAIRPQADVRVRAGADTDGTGQLREGIDYTLSYSNNVNVGTAKVLITGKGKYTGSRTVTFRIVPYDLSALPAKSGSGSQQIGYDISVNDGAPVAYQKGKTQPSVTVSYSDYMTDGDEPVLTTRVLSADDYKVIYRNVNTVSSLSGNRGQILISGKGNYKGTITSDSAKFEIVKADLSTAESRASDVPYRAGGGNFTRTKVSLYDTNGKKLTAGTDYDKNFTYYDVTDYMVSAYGVDLQTAASYELKIRDRSDFEEELEKAESRASQKIRKLDAKNDIVSAYQIICVRIRALNADRCNYTGTAYACYRIAASDIGKCAVRVNGTPVYNGTEQTLDPNDLTVTLGSGANRRELVYGRDYLIDEDSYVNHVKVGTAKVNIYGIGGYCGTKKVSFRIRAKKFSFFH